MQERIAAALAVVICVTVGSGRAHADDPRAARQHFDAGSKLYDLGKYRDAAHEYEEAYQAKSDPALLFNIGQAYRAAGNNGEAVTAYKSYLRRVPDAPNRVEVEGHIARLQKLLDEQRATQQSPPTGTLAPTAPSPPVATTPTTNAQLTAAPRVEQTERTPLYKKWWLWTAVGGAIVVGAGVALAVAYTTPKDAASPANTYGVSLH